jgi:hypothetical protein
MSMQLAPRLVRTLPWAQSELVEGTEALLWPIDDPGAAAEEAPDSAGAFRAVLSWARPQVLRFETATPEPLPELVLASTLAVGGPAQFAVRKTYQIGTTAAFEPPAVVHIVERRDLFRVPVAAPVQLRAETGDWSLHSMDCSLGGLRLCVPAPLEVGSEAEVTVRLLGGCSVTLPVRVRHSHLYEVEPRPVVAHRRPPGEAPTPTPPHYVLGLQFVKLPAEAERRLSEFVGRHQRRLMPKVPGRTPIEYCPGSRRYYLEALASEISPGSVVFESRQGHLPGERLSLRARLGRQDYEFQACVVACQGHGHEDGTSTYVLKAFFDEGDETLEAAFRKALRDLAIERVASST